MWTPARRWLRRRCRFGHDPDGVAQRLRRRLPARPDPHALLGTAFHDWVQRFFHAERLFDLDDLPGAVDRDAGDSDELAELQAAFAVSPWAARTPIRCGRICGTRKSCSPRRAMRCSGATKTACA